MDASWFANQIAAGAVAAKLRISSWIGVDGIDVAHDNEGVVRQGLISNAIVRISYVNAILPISTIAIPLPLPGGAKYAGTGRPHPEPKAGGNKRVFDRLGGHPGGVS